MNSFVRFGVILHHTATIAGWIFCLILLGHPEDEKAERMQQGFVQWQTLFGEKKAKRAFVALLIAMVASKLVLPVGLNQI